MLISLIAAMARNRVIGNAGTIPWQLPEDLHWFREHTMGHTLLMGRRTFEAIGRPLPGRQTIVVSRNPDYQAKGCIVASDMETALHCAASAEELFVCGGGAIYRQTLALAHRLYLTELDMEIAGDTFFPEFNPLDFHLVYHRSGSGAINHRYLIYQRRAVTST